VTGKKEQEIIEKNESEFRHISHMKKRAFLAAFAECGTVTHAAEIAGISRRMVQYWKRMIRSLRKRSRLPKKRQRTGLNKKRGGGY